jgi:hypothetical protein
LRFVRPCPASDCLVDRSPPGLCRSGVFPTSNVEFRTSSSTPRPNKLTIIGSLKMANFHQIGSLQAPRFRTLKFPCSFALVLENRQRSCMFPRIQNLFSPEKLDLERNLNLQIGSLWYVLFALEKSQIGRYGRF